MVQYFAFSDTAKIWYLNCNLTKLFSPLKSSWIHLKNMYLEVKDSSLRVVVWNRVQITLFQEWRSYTHNELALCWQFDLASEKGHQCVLKQRISSMFSIVFMDFRLFDDNLKHNRLHMHTAMKQWYYQIFCKRMKSLFSITYLCINV